MAGNYRLVNVGNLDAIAGMDPDVAALIQGNELDALDMLGGRGASAGWNLAIGQDATQAMIQAKLAQQGTLVREESPAVSREYPVGFDSVTPVPAGAVATIIQQPQVLFRSERFVVPSDIAGSFLILDIKVGKDSMFGAAGAVAARTFDERGVGVRLRLATAQVSQQLIVQVQNISGADQRFFATMIGTAIEQA